LSTYKKIKMGLADIYVDATTKQEFPSEKSFQNIWDEWLWGTDCNEMIDEKCGDMNHMHVLGILLALIESMMHDKKGEEDNETMENLLPDIPLVHLNNKAISDYSLRELTNQVECMQLSWGQVLSHGDFETYYKVLKRLFARFGHIIHHAYPSVDNIVLDDPQYITQIPSTSGLFITTRKYIRQMVCVFLALFR
jgi:hypothetical protein